MFNVKPWIRKYIILDLFSVLYLLDGFKSDQKNYIATWRGIYTQHERKLRREIGSLLYFFWEKTSCLYNFILLQQFIHQSSWYLYSKRSQLVGVLRFHIFYLHIHIRSNQPLKKKKITKHWKLQVFEYPENNCAINQPKLWQRRIGDTLTRAWPWTRFIQTT